LGAISKVFRQNIKTPTEDNDMLNESKTQNDYRAQIYSNYAHQFQDSSANFDDKEASRWGRAYAWYLRRWWPNNNSARVGELACGNGKLLHVLKMRGYSNLSAVDISPAQVEIAKQVTDDVTLGSALDWLDARKESFDLLVSLDLIEHFNKGEALQFIELIYAALKPGGRIVIQTPNADSPFGLQHRYNDLTHEFLLNANLISRLLLRSGFTNVVCREQGPVPWGYSVASTARFIIWRGIRAGLQIWNIAETGTTLPVLTRVFLISAIK
jgi:2-polyprenyl-3-methyl-5-hydroxy-6-metoxy-1,4-benzoquinol methylase